MRGRQRRRHAARLYAWAEQDARLRDGGDTGAAFGSVVNAARFRNLARVFNGRWTRSTWRGRMRAVRPSTSTMRRLLRRLADHGVDMVCPLTWMGNIFMTRGR